MIWGEYPVVPLLFLMAASVLRVSTSTELQLWDVWDRREGKEKEKEVVAAAGGEQQPQRSRGFQLLLTVGPIKESRN